MVQIDSVYQTQGYLSIKTSPLSRKKLNAAAELNSQPQPERTNTIPIQAHPTNTNAMLTTPSPSKSKPNQTTQLPRPSMLC